MRTVLRELQSNDAPVIKVEQNNSGVKTSLQFKC